MFIRGINPRPTLKANLSAACEARTYQAVKCAVYLGRAEPVPFVRQSLSQTLKIA
jgi:hypothetical protein